MRTGFIATLVALAAIPSARAHGLLIPDDKSLPPLAMVHHKVAITIEDQVATTKIQQVFRNHTTRQLEATYIFPIPKGASVNRFSMTVDGKDQSGELMPADKARQIYTDIVRRTQDPGLLEYIGNNLMRLRIFPILPKVDQKVEISFQSVIPADSGIIEYVYPLKTDGKATRTLEEFSINATIRSQHKIQNIYSPTHAISMQRISDKETKIVFERNQALLDKDFQLLYTVGDKDIGLTPMFYRPVSSENGFFMLLVTPQVSFSQTNVIPRDLVLVLDTSGSMTPVKMDQAKKALKHFLSNLNPQDRFAILNFSTTVNRYRDQLVESNSEQIDHAKKWVDGLRAAGGTAIQDALLSALELRSKDEGRSFTVVFFTDGQPTIGETKPENILRSVEQKNSANTRIFTFGVGDDVNATMLDQLAEKTRSVSTYVREAEDIEAKVSSLHGKISHPVLANLRLATSDNVRLEEVYPPQIPDLFHGGQVVVLGRYTGQGPAAIKLSGMIGMEAREFVYETTFLPKTGEDREFVEQIWARRKVGYLLDQIRANGEKKELMDELLALAKKYSIATPYTSHLIVPDAPMPVAPGRPMAGAPGGAGMPAGPGLGFGGGDAFGPPADGRTGAKTVPPPKVLDYAKANQQGAGGLAKGRGGLADRELDEAARRFRAEGGKGDAAKRLADAAERTRDLKAAYDNAKQAFERGEWRQAQAGKVGVDLSCAGNELRNQTRLAQTAVVACNGRNVMELGGAWIDEGFNPKSAAVIVKAQSDAYFRILEKQPKMKDVFRLGNFLVWVTPSNTTLVIDANDGKETLTDEEIDKLFVQPKK